MKEFIFRWNKNGRWLYRPQYQLKKIMWEFNPYDSDLNPYLSIPHGDDYSPTHHTLKLNVDNGYIYTARNRRCVGKVDKKELERCWIPKSKKRSNKIQNQQRTVTYGQSICSSF